MKSPEWVIPRGVTSIWVTISESHWVWSSKKGHLRLGYPELAHIGLFEGSPSLILNTLYLLPRKTSINNVLWNQFPHAIRPLLRINLVFLIPTFGINWKNSHQLLIISHGNFIWIEGLFNYLFLHFLKAKSNHTKVSNTVFFTF